MASDEYLGPLEVRRARMGSLRAELAVAQRDKSSLVGSIDYHRSYDVAAEQALVASLEGRRRVLMDAVASQKATIEAIERSLRATLGQQVSLLQVRRFFSAEQKRLRSESRRLREQLGEAQGDIAKCKVKLAEARERSAAAKDRLAEHDRFDVSRATRQLAEADAEVQGLTVALSATEDEIRRMEARVQGPLSEYRNLQARLVAVNADIQAANEFEERLGNAADGRERAMIHGECEVRLGDGKPRQVTRAKASEKRYLENNIPKVGRKILEELVKFDRVVERLVVDGNNMCYEGQRFIGLVAIQALLRSVSGRFRVAVVFDASIRRLMRAGDQDIESKLKPGAEIYVSPTRSAADEYLMKISGNDPRTFILSNDRFVDYSDFDVVKCERVLRFMIAEGRLMVNGLDVSADLACSH